MRVPPVSYKRHRFSRELIAHAVWLYYRFPLSFRLIEEMLLERGIFVSYETIRRWSQKFGAPFARRLRRKRATSGDIWHLDEVRIVIRGQSLTGCGVRLIRMATFSMKSCRRGATRKRQDGC